MADYTPQMEAAQRAIAENGIPAFVVRGTLLYPSAVLITEYEARERDGELIQAEDVKLLMAGSAQFVLNGETDIINAKDDQRNIDLWYRVVPGGTRPLAPSGVPILYEVQGRPIPKP